MGLPMARRRVVSARPALMAISASPFEFSYQKASPSGTSENVRARSRTRPDADSRVPLASSAARNAGGAARSLASPSWQAFGS